MEGLNHLNDEQLKNYYGLYKNGISKNSRFENIKIQGMDTKYCYHLVRLLNECEQILSSHDLDLEQNNEMLKSIRRGEWELKRVEEYFEIKEKSLDLLYASSTLRNSPDEFAIKSMLLNCLESHYGSLDNAIKKDVQVLSMIAEIESIIDKYR